MLLTPREIEELPLPCALYDKDGGLVAQTAEWRGRMPGAVAYPYRRSRLIVTPERGEEDSLLVVERLLAALRNASESLKGDDALRVAMLETSIRLISGDPNLPTGTTEDAVEMARAGILARSSAEFKVGEIVAANLMAPAVIALILVQLAANAERHEQATVLALESDGRRFHLSWEESTSGQENFRVLKTSRVGSDRERWGLGFARLAADAVGASIYAPVSSADGVVTATIETGLERLALPLACLRAGQITKSTPGWDEETGLTPGRVFQSPRLAPLLSQARAKMGEIASHQGWNARLVDDSTWFAIPPQNAVDRARDIVKGLVHEKALWQATDEPYRSQIFAYAALLDVLLDTPFPRMPAPIWNETMHNLERYFEMPPVPRFSGMSAIDARVVAVFASEFGERFIVENDDIYLVIRSESRSDPFMRLYLNEGDADLQLS